MLKTKRTREAAVGEQAVETYIDAENTEYVEACGKIASRSN